VRISYKTGENRGRIRTDYLEVNLDDEGEVVQVREAGDIVGKPSNDYATQE
jgi:hypothetical protein